MTRLLVVVAGLLVGALIGCPHFCPPLVGIDPGLYVSAIPRDPDYEIEVAADGLTMTERYTHEGKAYVVVYR